MNSIEVKDLVAEFAPIIRDHINSIVDKLRDDLLAKIAEIPEPDHDALAIAAADLIPVPESGEKGADGEDGASVTVDDVLPAIIEHIDNKLSEIPKAKDGDPGKDGSDGADGKAVDAEEIAKMVADEVSQMPKPRDGRDGKDGRDALDRIDADAINKRIDESVYRLLPKIEIDGRSVILSTTSPDGTVDIKTHSLPHTLYKGVWRAGVYDIGDMVTFGGSLWHCNESGEDKPGDASKSWTLCAKKGRDGKNA